MESAAAATAAPNSPPTDHVTLCLASQPDIVRAAQKDDMYASQTVEACQDGLRRLVGPYTALRYARESKLVALALYHALTTGRGVQTLGEEYCNMIQASGTGYLPGLPQRASLVLLRCLAPYLAETLSARLDRGAEAQAMFDEDPTTATAILGGSNGRGSSRSAHHDDNLVELSDDGGDDDDDGLGATSGDESGGGFSGLLRAAQGRLRRGLTDVGQAVEGRWALWRTRTLRAWPRARPALAYLSRVHLALFYCYGIYYSLPQRLTGTRYVSIFRPNQRPNSYHVLGLLLLLQLAVSGLIAIQQAGGPLTLIDEGLRQGGAAPLFNSTLAGSGGGGGGSNVTPVLEEEEEEWGEFVGNESGKDIAAARAMMKATHRLGMATAIGAGGSATVGDSVLLVRQEGGSSGPMVTVKTVAAAWVGGGSLAPGASPCPLCLSARRSPTSTPCGHVFCWECVAQWCAEKTECPLCRARVTLQELIGVYHAGL